MSLLVTLAQVKDQLENKLISCPGVTQLIHCSNDGGDVYALLAGILQVKRVQAKEVLIWAVHKVHSRMAVCSPGKNINEELIDKFFELYPELQAWYSDPYFYLRYRA